MIDVMNRKNPAEKLQAYLLDVLGADTTPRPWPGAKALPFFVTDSFTLFELSLFGHSLVIALDRRPGTLSPSEVAARVERLRSAAPNVVYATERLALRERRALIGRKMPFIVPGNQLYLPDLGIDLREYLQRGAGAGKSTTLKPSAQALLIASLLAKPWHRELHPATMARALGYTVMTASRAANDLVAAGLAQAGHKAQPGAPRYLTFEATKPEEAWRAAEPLVVSPLLRTVWIAKVPAGLATRVAGIEALARQTMLAAPDHPVHAVKREDWLSARKADPTLDDLGRDGSRIELQIWSYSPNLASGDQVDPLSLIASLRDNTDERVQVALNELREGLRW